MFFDNTNVAVYSMKVCRSFNLLTYTNEIKCSFQLLFAFTFKVNERNNSDKLVTQDK